MTIKRIAIILYLFKGGESGQAAAAGGRVHPRTRAGGGARKKRVPHQRDEVDCGRGRSERSERSSSSGWLPEGSESWLYIQRRGDYQSFDFLVTLLLVFLTISRRNNYHYHFFVTKKPLRKNGNTKPLKYGSGGGFLCKRK